MSALAKRYARAALAAASEAHTDPKAQHQALETLAQNVRAFWQAYLAEPTLVEVLRNPVLQTKRAQVLGAVCTHLKIEPLTQKLLILLANNDRMPHLGELVTQIEAAVDARLGRVRAHVRFAQKPDDKQCKLLEQTLHKQLGKPVVLTVAVDPTLIAGLVCQIGDTTFDSSVKRQLSILTERLGTRNVSI